MAKDQNNQDDLSDLLNEISKHVDSPDSSSHDSKNSSKSVSSRFSDSIDLSTSSFPTEMSCTQAFNDLVACYSIGGQMRHMYRYGTISYCLDKREKFKFCILVKGNTAEEKKKKIARFYKERLAAQKLKMGSSEDVWTVRRTKVEKPFVEHES